MLNNDLFVLEMVFGLAIHQIKDSVQVFTHICISRLQGLNAVFIHLHVALVPSHACWQVEACSLKSEAEFLKVCFELFVLLWHLVAICRMVIIDAKVNELVLHLIDDLPACSLVLLLEVLCFSLYYKLN